MSLWLLPALAAAATLHVDPNDVGAYPTIASAVAAATGGDRIEIAPGTYAECVATPAGLAFDLVGVGGSAETVVVYGGSSCQNQPFLRIGAGATVSATGLSFEVGARQAIKVIGATLSLDDVVVQGSNYLGNQLTAGVHVEDGTLVVTDSRFSDLQSEYGGGIYALDSDVSVSRTTFSHNRGYQYAGAIYFRTTGENTLSVDQSTFDTNLASMSDGGAIYALGATTYPASIAITDSVFTSNKQEDPDNDGGAIAAYVIDDVVIDGCLFDDNFAWGGGGALLLAGGTSLAVTNTTFVRNVSHQGRGGAVYSTGHASETWSRNLFLGNWATSASGCALALRNAADAVVENNNFVGGACTDAVESGNALYAATSAVRFRNNIVAYGSGGAAIHLADAATAANSTFTYSDFYGNTSSDIGGTATFSTTTGGNRIDPPLFIEFTDNDDFDNDDFVLAVGSLLIDAGDPTTEDPDGSVADIGAYGGGSVVRIDADGDGSYSNRDCNDANAEVHPGAVEACNEIDDDCDEAIDEAGATGESTWYADADDDAYGDVDIHQDACAQPPGTVSDASDCDDADETTWPGAPDAWYDGVDSDCAGNADDDQDGDGFGVAVDCDDTDATVHPGAADAWYDGVDSDCAGNADDDQDGDGVGVATDCDDTDPGAWPGAPEIADDGVDQDCDGSDSTSAPPPEVPPGCGCDGTGAANLAGWMSLVPVVLLRRRRQRA